MGRKNTSSSKKPLTLVVCGGYNLEREGLKALLSGKANIKVADHAKSLQEAIAKARDTGADIIILSNVSDLFENKEEEIRQVSSHLKILAAINPRETTYIP